jgi:hypothetical protein
VATSAAAINRSVCHHPRSTTYTRASRVRCTRLKAASRVRPAGPHASELRDPLGHLTRTPLRLHRRGTVQVTAMATTTTIMGAVPTAAAATAPPAVLHSPWTTQRACYPTLCTVTSVAAGVSLLNRRRRGPWPLQIGSGGRRRSSNAEQPVRTRVEAIRHRRSPPMLPSPAVMCRGTTEVDRRRHRCIHWWTSPRCTPATAV